MRFMITQKMLSSATDNNKIFKYRDQAIEYNGFKLYRSGSEVGTIIEFNFPTSDGILGQAGIIEVIDASYRNTSIAYALYGSHAYDNTALTNFNSKGKNNTWSVYNTTNYNKTTALTSEFTNTAICSQWRSLSTDQTAKYNTTAWMADSHFNKSGYAPYWTTHLTVDDGGWVIPNEFELIVIYCCSDKLDSLDPTFNSNKDKGLGYTATNGRFYPNASYPAYWSSTEESKAWIRAVYSSGSCYHYRTDYSLGVVPVREYGLYNIYTDANHPLEFNGFKLYRSSNGYATTIEYHWPNTDGTMGELRKMEVIDAQYRFIAAYAPSDAWNYDNTALAHFSVYGNDGTWYTYNSYSYAKAIPTNIVAVQNSGICSQWRHLSTDKTAKYNTAAWMADDHFNLEGYAPYGTTHLNIDGGNWSIPNEFQLIVIWCCSDKLDEMDPTFESNKDKGLGYTSTIGRFSTSNGIVLSSTECESGSVLYVHPYGSCSRASNSVSGHIVPIREL